MTNDMTNDLTDARPVIGIWTKDAVRLRVLRDALSLCGYGAQDLNRADASVALVLDDGAPKARRQEWDGEGTAVIALDPGTIRLGALLRRVKHRRETNRAATGVLAFGAFRLDLALLTLTDTDKNTTVNLTEKERDILARLHREAGRALDRRALLGDVWGYADAVETHTLETHIYRLRQKLEADPAKPLVLVTDEAGYRLVIG